MSDLRVGGRSHPWLMTALVALDPLTLLLSLGYAALARASGARVAWDRTHGMVICTGSSPRLHGGGGTTVGCVYVTSASDVRTEICCHESRHRDQWAIAGPLFAVLYGAEILRTKTNFTRNVWERWAGLEDGGYLPASTATTGSATTEPA